MLASLQFIVDDTQKKHELVDLVDSEAMQIDD